MSDAQYTSEATTDTFQHEVLERSRDTPVLVDFWAPWCEPCKALGPVLEQVVAELNGQVWLVKVNTDENQELAGAFEIRSIPAVKAVVDGKVADEFTGALGKAEVKEFIARIMPSPEETALSQAVAALEAGTPEGVEAILEPARQSPHHRDVAMLILARAKAALGDTEAALTILDELANDTLVAKEAEQLRLSLQMADASGGADEAGLRAKLVADPKDNEARWALAGLLQAGGQLEPALDELMEIVKRDRAFRDDGGRKAILAILDGLGPDSDLAREVRGQLQIYL